MTDTTLPPLGNDGRTPGDPPAVPFWEMRATVDGTSAIDLRWLDGFIRKSVSPGAEAIWMREFSGTVERVWFNILPVGWIGEWHPSPVLLWVVPLSGRWFVETQHGSRVEMGPGEIHWGADTESAAENKTIRHRSGQIGDVPCVQIMVQFLAPPTGTAVGST